MAGTGGAGTAGSGGSPTEGPSCAGGLDCGGVSCCDSIPVPGGVFPMGRGSGTDAAAGNPDEQPEHMVNVAPFALDRFEITVGRFRKFMESYPGQGVMIGKGAIPGVAGSGWTAALDADLPAMSSSILPLLNCGAQQQTWTNAKGAKENLPVNCIGWYFFQAFCVWDGGRLPTEAEWEYAAAGGTENRLYPWGSASPDATRAVFGLDMFAGPIMPVGSATAGAGLFGHLDMAGNVWEFVFDQYDAAAYASPACVSTSSCVVMANPGTADSVIRGGGYLNDPLQLRAAQRASIPPGDAPSIGARCAR
jgi:formylglycine-generating enzyme required for sulfatase activity